MSKMGTFVFASGDGLIDDTPSTTLSLPNPKMIPVRLHCPYRFPLGE